MSIATTSRFSILRQDDDGPSTRKNQQKSKPAAVGAAKVNNKSQQNGNASAAKPKNKSKGKQKFVPMSDEQWQAWENRDQQVDGYFENNANSSKESQQPVLAKKSKKKNKSASPPAVVTTEEVSASIPEIADLGIDDATMQDIKANVTKIFETDFQANNVKEVNVRILEYRELLVQKDQQIAQLYQEIEKLKTELGETKKRNQMLCQILASAEMKGKAELQLQVDTLSKEKEALVEQMATLTISLEQERTKSNVLQKGSKKRLDSFSK